MTMHAEPSTGKKEPPLSLFQLLDPEVLANPYPLYHRLRSEDPVHWDPYLHAWVVTRYADVVHVFQRFSADRTPTPEQLTALGLTALTPLAEVMVLQMLFLDPPNHGRVRGLASKAFTARRVEVPKHPARAKYRLLSVAARSALPRVCPRRYDKGKRRTGLTCAFDLIARAGLTMQWYVLLAEHPPFLAQ